MLAQFHDRSRLSLFGITALLVTRAADLSSTVYGLVFVEGIAERNPAVRTVIGAAGLPGLVAIAIAGTLLVVLVVEWGTNVIRQNATDERLVVATYVGSYGTLAAVSAVATLHNLDLILQVSS